MARSRLIEWAGAGLLCASLLACGGGGDGGGDDDAGGAPPAAPSAASADLTAGGYAGTADTAARAASASLGSVALFTGDGSVVAAEASAARALRFDGRVQRLALGRLLDRHSAQRSGRAQALAVSSHREPCDSGSLLVTLDAAGNGNTVGDSVTVSSQGCVLDGQAVSGSVKVTLTAYSETSTASSGAAAVVYSGFGVAALKLDGRIDAQISEDASVYSLRLTHRGLTVTGLLAAPLQWFHSAAYRYGYGNASESVSFSGYVAVAGGYLKVDQLAPFVLSSGRPGRGALQLSGANGARVKVHAGTTRFGYEYYASGNAGNVPDAAAQGLAY